MRPARLLGLACAALLATAVAAAWLLPPRLDWSAERGRIAAIATHLLGQPVAIDGPVALTLLPEPTLHAGGVHIGGGLLQVRALGLRAAFWPLLVGRIVPRTLELQAPTLVLPWPLPAGMVATGAPSWPAGLDLRINDGAARVGTVTVAGIGARASITDTGTLKVSGQGAFGARVWAVEARLTRAGRDGASGLDLTARGRGALAGTEARVTGQFAADGSFAGQAEAHGGDLGALMAAPAVAFRAQGRVTAADGLIAADDLALDLGGAPARAAVALRLRPVQRLDLSLAAGRIDLDAWLPPLLHPAAAGARLPVGLDLSAEAADLAGARLRRLRCALDLAPDRAEVREATAVLPGDATLTGAGRLVRGEHPSFLGTLRLRGQDLPATAGWVARVAGVGAWAAARLPHGVDLTARVEASAASIALAGMSGHLNGAAFSGGAAWQPGAAPRLRARFDLSRLDLDPWTDQSWAGVTRSDLSGPGGVTVDLTIAAANARLRGEALTGFVLDGVAGGGGLDLRRLAATVDGARLDASGRVDRDLRVTGARVALSADRPAYLLQRLLGDSLPDRIAGATSRLGSATVTAAIDGSPEALTVPVVLRLGPALVAARARIDWPARAVAGQVWLRADDAVALAQRIGLASPGWLGDGALAVAAAGGWRGGALHVASLAVRAGALDATGALDWQARDDVPHLTGRVDATILPLPVPQGAWTDPLPVAGLRGWEAAIDLTAARVLAEGGPLLRDLHARIGVAGGTLAIAGLRATLGGGALTGSATLDGAASPPALAVDASLHGAMLDPPVVIGPVALAGGAADAAIRLAARGYSLAAMRATLAGQARVSASGGVMRGLDMPAVRAAVAHDEATGGDPAGDAPLRAALAGGATPYATLAADAVIAAGSLTLDDARLVGPDGTIEGSGVAGLAGGGLDLRLVLRPAMEGGAPGPEIGLQLTGPVGAPRRTPDLAGVLRWLSRG